MESADRLTLIRENNAAHEALFRLAGRLTDEELAHRLDSGWTVAAALAHLAFWDARAVLLIEKWTREGISPSPADTDVINDAVCELCLAVPPRTAADLAVRKSREVNRAIEALAPETVEKIQSVGTAVRLNRGEHKRRHMEEIERVLGEKG